MPSVSLKDMDHRSRWLLAGTSLLVVALVVTAIIASTGRNDLDIFLAAARDLLHGDNMYTKKYVDGFSYFYSPLFALMTSALLPLDIRLAKLLWGFAIIIASARCWIIIKRDLPEALTQTQRKAILFFALLFLFQALRDNINSSQVTPFVLWLSLEGLHRIRSRQWILGAFLIALGIDMKLIPLVLLPYLLYRREWRSAALTVAFAVALQFIPAIVVGWQYELDLLRTRWTMIDPSDVRHVLDEEEPSTIALGSLLSAYLSSEGGNPYTLDLPRNIAALDVRTISMLLTIGRLLLASLALYFLRWPPFVAARSRQQAWWEASYLLLCTVLIFPHQRNYSMLLATPAVVWIVCHMMMRFRRGEPNTRTWLALCVIVYLLTNAWLLLGQFAPIYNHYKLMSFMVIALIAMLLKCRPERIISVPPSLQ